MDLNDPRIPVVVLAVGTQLAKEVSFYPTTDVSDDYGLCVLPVFLVHGDMRVAVPEPELVSREICAILRMAVVPKNKQLADLETMADGTDKVVLDMSPEQLRWPEFVARAPAAQPGMVMMS